MLTNKPNKRWYDWDPTVSIAVSLLRNASPDNQSLVIDLIKEKGNEFGIKIVKQSFNGFGFFNKRWYDTDEKMSTAMETLRTCPPDVQKKIALDVINYLYNLDMEQI